MNTKPKVIINADDFGYSEGVNRGIIKAYEQGVLTSTTVLGNILTGNESLEGFINTSGIEKPSIGIGVHLNLTFGKPSLPDIWGMQEFARPQKGQPLLEWQESVWKEYFADFSIEKVEKEFISQIEKVKNQFGSIDHLDSHHSVASYHTPRDAYEAVAQRLDISIRGYAVFSQKTNDGNFSVETSFPSYAREKKLRTVDSLEMMYFHKSSDPIEAFCKSMATIQPAEVREYMFHPAIDDSKGAWRKIDLDILIHPKVIQKIKDLDIQLTTYGESAY